jgi:hypothetical protein
LSFALGSTTTASSSSASSSSVSPDIISKTSHDMNTKNFVGL